MSDTLIITSHMPKCLKYFKVITCINSRKLISKRYNNIVNTNNDDWLETSNS